MATDPCVGCGATSAGVFVCHHCGVPVRRLADAESERQALDELHGQLASADAPSALLLKNAFLPDDPRVLIDAGLRLLPVLENGAALDSYYEVSDRRMGYVVGALLLVLVILGVFAATQSCGG
jgi:hypothetical protein